LIFASLLKTLTYSPDNWGLANYPEHIKLKSRGFNGGSLGMGQNSAFARPKRKKGAGVSVVLAPLLRRPLGEIIDYKSPLPCCWAHALCSFLESSFERWEYINGMYVDYDSLGPSMAHTSKNR
jgi:hypothetical protein